VRAELSAFVIEPDGENSTRVLLTQSQLENGGSVRVESRPPMLRCDGEGRILREDGDDARR
jgi:hypothetical protein